MRSVWSSKWNFRANSGRSHGGENPKESSKYAKKEVVWSRIWVIFSPRISIFVSFRGEKGCNSTTRKPPLGGYTGWPMNCCPATQKVAILYIILTQNPSNWGSKIGSKIRLLFSCWDERKILRFSQHNSLRSKNCESISSDKSPKMTFKWPLLLALLPSDFSMESGPFQQPSLPGERYNPM